MVFTLLATVSWATGAWREGRVTQDAVDAHIFKRDGEPEVLSPLLFLEALGVTEANAVHSVGWSGMLAINALSFVPIAPIMKTVYSRTSTSIIAPSRMPNRWPLSSS